MKPKLAWWEIALSIISWPFIIVGGLIVVALILLFAPDSEPLPPEW